MDERSRASISGAYRAFHGELLKFFGKRLDSTADAADLAQDAFTHWLDWRNGGEVQQPRAFLFQIARNLLRDHWRRQQVRPQACEGMDSEQALNGMADEQEVSPLEQIEQQQRLHLLGLALDDLSPRRREAFILHKFDGLSQAEVANRMGISLSMVEKHIASALLHCKQRVQGQSTTDET